MTPPGKLGRHAWLLAAAGVAVLVAVHLIAFGFVAAALALPAAAVALLAAVALVNHLGLLGSLGAWLRRRGRSAS